MAANTNTDSKIMADGEQQTNTIGAAISASTRVIPIINESLLTVLLQFARVLCVSCIAYWQVVLFRGV